MQAYPLVHPSHATPRLITADLEAARQRAVILEMTRDHFQRMNGEIQGSIALTILDIFGLDEDIDLGGKLEALCVIPPLTASSSG